MKIHNINILQFNTFLKPVKSNDSQPVTSQVRLNPQPTKDLVNFTSKIPSLMAPTMEDIINKTKAVDIMRYNILRLGEYDIHCPCCGRVMLPLSKYKDAEAKILATTSSKEMLDIVAEHKRYLHPTERKAFSMMKSDINSHPDRNLLDTLRKRLSRSERRLVFIQSKIFNNIELLSRKLPEKSRRRVNDLINETYERILDPRETSRFSRHTFIEKLKDIFVPESVRSHFRGHFPAWIYTELQNQMIKQACELPSAHNNIDAFIVKYSKRDYKMANPNQKIALRMLSESLVSIEHIKARFRHGETIPSNLSLECASCNNRRGDAPVFEQITENPSMINNYSVYISELCDLHKLGLVEKSYIRGQHKTYYDESLGLLDADISSIVGQTQYPQKAVNNSLTPTKAERRMARKLKLKQKKQQSSINTKKG